MNDLKIAICLLFGALLICVASMLVSHSNWVRAFDALIAENVALEEVIALQASEGDMLVRQIGEMAEHGFCEEASNVNSDCWCGELPYWRRDRALGSAFVGHVVGED